MSNEAFRATNRIFEQDVTRKGDFAALSVLPKRRRWCSKSNRTVRDPKSRIDRSSGGSSLERSLDTSRARWRFDTSHVPRTMTLVVHASADRTRRDRGDR